MDNIFLIISIVFFIIAHIFLIIQGAINFKFEKSKDRKIIVERTLYEQFSYEVYSSINKLLFLDYSIKENCSDYQNKKVSFTLNLDTYFDCRYVHNTDLISYCRENIVSNYTNCNSENSYVNYNDLKNFLQIDERLRYCKYYSKYTQNNIDRLFNVSICQTGETYFYESLLANSVPNKDYEGNPGICPENYKKCGILDTKGNILCLPKYANCPMNQIIYLDPDTPLNDHTIKINEDKIISFINNNENNIVISIILSENKPLSHEWDLMVRETDEKLDEDEVQKKRNISIIDLELLNMEEDTIDYINDLNIKVEEVKNNNNIKGYSETKYNKNQNLNIYTRNYIGFKNSEEFIKFRKIFNDNEVYKNNPLYKLSSSKHNPLITIILSVVFLILSIAFLILKITNIINDSILKIIFYIFIGLVILFLVGELIIIAFHFYTYKKINIDMDDKMRKVLDLYNHRRMECQKYRIISSVINAFSLVFAFISFCRNTGSNQEMQN